MNASEANQLEVVLQRIGSESFEAAQAREKSTFANFAGQNEERLILFGAGPLGRLVLHGLNQAGLRPITFADNNERLWNTDIEGVPVLAPSTASDLYRDSACFVVTIYNGSPARHQLKALGCKNVAPSAALFWKYGEVFTPNFGIELPHKLPAYADEIKACREALADEDSRRELAGQLEWRYWLDDDALPPSLSPSETYFPMDLMVPSEEEVFVDCGSFQGDILPSFTSHWNGKFKHIFAIEPDPQNREVLGTTAGNLGLKDRLTALPTQSASKVAWCPLHPPGQWRRGLWMVGSRQFPWSVEGWMISRGRSRQPTSRWISKARNHRPLSERLACFDGITQSWQFAPITEVSTCGKSPISSGP